MTVSECLLDSLDYCSGVSGFIFESGSVTSFPNGVSCDCVYEYELVREAGCIIGKVESDAEFIRWS